MVVPIGPRHLDAGQESGGQFDPCLGTLAVIALNAAALRDAGVRNLHDLNQIAPNIEVQVLRMYGAELKYSFWRSDFCGRINSTNPPQWLILAIRLETAFSTRRIRGPRLMGSQPACCNLSTS
jgi:hypothetical protein